MDEFKEVLGLVFFLLLLGWMFRDELKAFFKQDD